MNGHPVLYDGFAMKQGGDVYSVVVVWPEADEDARAAARRVLESVQIESK